VLLEQGKARKDRSAMLPSELSQNTAAPAIFVAADRKVYFREGAHI